MTEIGSNPRNNMNIFHLFIVVFLAVSATCTTAPNPDHFTETYTIDTTGSCNGGNYGSPPICSIDSLNRKLRIAKRVMRQAINDIAATLRSSSLNCRDQNMHNLPLMSGTGSDLVGSLRTGVQIMTQVALNISITNCHTRGRCSLNVLQPIVDVICEMKRMLMYVEVDQDIFRAIITYRVMDRTELTEFTCASLGTALDVLRFLENDINRIFRNI